MKKRLFVVFLGLTLLACSQFTNLLATDTSLATATYTPTLIPTASPDLRAAAFGDPILAAIQEVTPHLYDDFSSDQGWFGVIGDGDYYPSMALVNDGHLQAVDDGSRHFTHLQFSSMAGVTDFVLTVEAQFAGAAGRSGGRSIGLCWWPGDDDGERFLLDESGWFEGATCKPDGPCPAYLSGNLDPIALGETVYLTLIHKQHESAVYVNGVPLVYHDLPYEHQAQGFSLCPHSTDQLQSDVLYDNLNVWMLKFIDIP